ncbi:CRP-like cAMP-binding protein [Pedobacter sp. UYP30]|uniref:Crp/Fnr family transcriptional regulator n=1 Tax=Pedobacter sp. UYP30 TaxID=1756400 RepID=UPI003392884A
MFATLTKFLDSKASFSKDQLEEICSFFSQIKTKRNQILLGFEDVCKYYYFINKGCVRLYTFTADGNESSRYFAFEGNFVTALPSFIDQQPAEEFLQTIISSELLSIRREDFYRLVKTLPAFAKIYTEILELGFIVAQKRIYGFQGFDALEKVKWIIKHQPKLLISVSNRMAASYLGIAPATLSRVKAKLN